MSTIGRFASSDATTRCRLCSIRSRNDSIPSAASKNWAPKYVAKPSESQRWCQLASVTASPNHWCAISCETVPSMFLPLAMPCSE